MITIVIFILGVIATYVSSICTLINKMSWWSISLIALGAIVGIIVINGLVATICCKVLPKKWFDYNIKFYNVNKKECRIYEKFGIKKWKDKTLELGKCNGFRKNKIQDQNSPEYAKRFLIESNMGIMTHFVSAIISFPAIFILPMKFWLPMGLPIAITSFILNIVPIMILRYNVPRLKTLLKFSERRKTQMQQ